MRADSNRPGVRLHSVQVRQENWGTVSPAVRSVIGSAPSDLAGADRGTAAPVKDEPRRKGWKARIGAVARVLTDEFLLMPTQALVEGAGAPAAAERILLMAWQVRGANLLVQGAGWRWTWRGRLAKPLRVDGALVLRDGNIALQVDPSRVTAVYRCGFGGRSGIVMYDDARAFMTLWSNQSGAFERWLRAAVPGGR